MDESELLIKDKVQGLYETAEALFHFHPDVQVSLKPNNKSGTLVIAGNKTLTWYIDHGHGRLEKSSWYPKFGVSVPSICLQIKLIKGVSVFRLRFSKN